MTLAERLDTYRLDMGLSKRELARVLDIAPTTVSGYFSGSRTPSYDDLIGMARSLCVSLDWLSGLSPGPRWGTEVLQLRRSLREVAKNIEAADASERVAAVTKLIMSKSPLFSRPWFISGILGLTEADCEAFLAGEADMGEQTPGRLADFIGLPVLWLLLGDNEYYTVSPQHDWSSVNVAFEDAGLSPEEVSAQITTLARIVASMRRTTSSATKDD